MNNFTPLGADNLPPANTLVLCKRKAKSKYQGEVYLAIRTDKPLSTNPDASSNCYWYGNPISREITCESNGHFGFSRNFSDVTVESWKVLDLKEISGFYKELEDA